MDENSASDFTDETNEGSNIASFMSKEEYIRILDKDVLVYSTMTLSSLKRHIGDVTEESTEQYQYFNSWAEFAEVSFEVLAFLLVSINAGQRGQSNLSCFGLAAISAALAKKKIVEDIYRTLEFEYEHRHLNIVKYSQWLVFCITASLALTSSEITISQGDFVNIWLLKLSISLLGQFSQLLQQTKMARCSELPWNASQFFTYFLGLSYMSSLLIGLCNDNPEMTACAKKVISYDKMWVPVMIGLTSSCFAVCMAHVIYQVSISAFQSSEFIHSKITDSSYLYKASVFICEMIPRSILTNDMNHLLNEIFGGDFDVRLSLLCMLTISVLPDYVITMKKLQLCEIHGLIVSVRSKEDDFDKYVSPEVARDLSVQLFRAGVKDDQPLNAIARKGSIQEDSPSEPDSSYLLP